MKTSILVGGCLLLALGCAGKGARPSQTAVGQNEEQTDENRLGAFAAQTDGKNVWPPQGEGCESYIACCEDLTALDGMMGLQCQIATVVLDGSCPAAQDKMRAIAGEQGLDTPASCE